MQNVSDCSIHSTVTLPNVLDRVSTEIGHHQQLRVGSDVLTYFTLELCKPDEITASAPKLLPAAGCKSLTMQCVTPCLLYKQLPLHINIMHYKAVACVCLQPGLCA